MCGSNDHMLRHRVDNWLGFCWIGGKGFVALNSQHCMLHAAGNKDIASSHSACCLCDASIESVVSLWAGAFLLCYKDEVRAWGGGREGRWWGARRGRGEEGDGARNMAGAGKAREGGNEGICEENEVIEKLLFAPVPFSSSVFSLFFLSYYFIL